MIRLKNVIFNLLIPSKCSPAPLKRMLVRLGRIIRSILRSLTNSAGRRRHLGQGEVVGIEKNEGEVTYLKSSPIFDLPLPLSTLFNTARNLSVRIVSSTTIPLPVDTAPSLLARCLIWQHRRRGSRRIVQGCPRNELTTYCHRSPTAFHALYHRQHVNMSPSAHMATSSASCSP